MDTQAQIQNSKEHMRMLYGGISKMKEITEKMVLRATSYACDMLAFGQELRYCSHLKTFSYFHNSFIFYIYYLYMYVCHCFPCVLSLLTFHIISFCFKLEMI